MKRIILLFWLTVCSALLVCGQDKGIAFETGRLKQALAKAKKTGKYLFMDCYTAWCGPCKQMAREVFTDAKVAEYFNATFINYKMDMEKGEGPEVSKRYEVAAYPTFLFLDGDGQLVYKVIGAKKPEAFIAAAREVFNDQNVMKLGAVYKQHLQDSAFMHHYFSMLETARMTGELQTAVNDYLNAMPPAGYLQPANWQLLRTYVTDHRSPVVKHVLQHAPEFFTAFGKDEVTDYIAGTYWTRYRALTGLSLPETAQIDDFIREVQAVRMTFTPPLLSRLHVWKYYTSKDLPRLAATLEDLFTYGFLTSDVTEDPDLQAMMIMEMGIYCKALTENGRKEYNPQIAAWFKTLSGLDAGLEYRLACCSMLYDVLQPSGDTALTAQIGTQKDELMKEYYRQNPVTREILEASKGMMEPAAYEHMLQEIKRLGVKIRE